MAVMFREGIAWHGSVMAWQGTELVVPYRRSRVGLRNVKAKSRVVTAQLSTVMHWLSVVTVPLGETLFCIGYVGYS